MLPVAKVSMCTHTVSILYVLTLIRLKISESKQTDPTQFFFYTKESMTLAYKPKSWSLLVKSLTNNVIMNLYYFQ